MAWGPFGEVINIPKVELTSKTQFKEAPSLLTVKDEDEKKWWKFIYTPELPCSKSTFTYFSPFLFSDVELTYRQPQNHLRTPRTLEGHSTLFKCSPRRVLQQEIGCSSIQLSESTTRCAPLYVSEPEPERGSESTYAHPHSAVAGPATLVTPPMARSTTAPLLTRSVTPTAGGLLTPPALMLLLGKVRSMDRLQSAMELKEEMESTLREETSNENKGKKKDGTVKEKEERKKDGTVKEKKVEKENKLAAMEAEGGATTKNKKSSKEKSMPKAQTLRVSTSAFKVGALPPEQQKTLGPKKYSILGLGLPSTMRLSNMREGSTASSINFNMLGSHPNLG